MELLGTQQYDDRKYDVELHGKGGLSDLLIWVEYSHRAVDIDEAWGEKLWDTERLC